MVLLTLLSIVQALALIFATMTWISHRTMRRARLDGENDEFLARQEPATARDFYPAFTIVIGFMLAATYLAMTGGRGNFALFAVFIAFLVLVQQLIVATRSWNMSITD